ncbi:unnamed protein product, partial [Rotaria magnacalcarata]
MNNMEQSMAITDGQAAIVPTPANNNEEVKQL